MFFIVDSQARIHIIFPVIISLLIGIACAYFFLIKISFSTLFFFIFLPSSLILLSIFYNACLSKKMLILFCYLSLWGGAFRFLHIQSTYDTRLKRIENHTFNIIGHVQQKNTCSNRSGYCLQLRTNSLIDVATKEYIPCDMRLLIYTSNNQFNVGDKIKLYNASITPSTNQAFNTYLFREGITTTIFGNKGFLIARPLFSVSRFLATLRESIKERLAKKMSATTFCLFSSLFFGYKTNQTDEYKIIKNSFKIWGLSHYLARSGLHLVIFVFLFLLFFRRIPFSLQNKLRILTLCIFIYYILSWSSISFIRATLSCLIANFYSFFDQQINSLHILTIVTLLVLLKNPYHLFYLDFQLSFLLSFSLLYFNHNFFLHKRIKH